MVDLTKPDPDSQPPDREPPIGSTVVDRAKPWVWSFAQVVFIIATIGNVAYDAWSVTYNGERASIGLGFMTLVVLGVNVDRLFGRSGR